MNLKGLGSSGDRPSARQKRSPFQIYHQAIAHILRPDAIAFLTTEERLPLILKSIAPSLNTAPQAEFYSGFQNGSQERLRKVPIFFNLE
ncbi:MAG: hypothetical protein WBA57_05630 [Elainellaceae cyanobacterium]